MPIVMVIVECKVMFFENRIGNIKPKTKTHCRVFKSAVKGFTEVLLFQREFFALTADRDRIGADL